MKKAVLEFFRKGDMVLLGLCVAASLMGLALIYSATRFLNSNRFVVVQAAGLLVGVLVYFVMTMVDIELFTQRTWWVMGIFNLLLILSLRTPLGVTVGGNRNWIAIPGVPVNIQPAEVAKLFLVLLMALQYAQLRDRGPISRPGAVLSMAAHAFFMAALNLVVSGDFGMGVIYILIFITMAWCAGVRWWWFALGAGGLGGAMVLLWNRLPAYIQSRISVIFLRNDPQGAGWQQEHSITAIGSGGLMGKGFLKGTMTQRGGVNAQYADEIFAVCGEEFGLVGCTVVMLLLAAIILRCFWVGRHASSPMSAMIAMGYGGMFLAQTVINIGMCLYVFPVVGLTLPFFSYGGTSIITLFMAAGVVSGVKARYLPSWLQDRSDR